MAPCKTVLPRVLQGTFRSVNAFSSESDFPMIRIGLIGDHDNSVAAHVAIPRALNLAATFHNVSIETAWLSTDKLCIEELDDFDGLWCVPASPYRSTNGAILAIQHARENRIPFLGTCGGFQHAILEYGRNVLGLANANHEEMQPDADVMLISRLACELVEKTECVQLVAGSLLRAAYGNESITESYHCRYGLNPKFLTQVTSGRLSVAAYDASGAIRAMELRDHPFFVITLFQPERAALVGALPPIVNSYVGHCVKTADEQT